MTDSASYCCGRTMTVIGVDRVTADVQVGVQLHSCPSCGRHAWRRDGREVERSELLDVLRSGERARPAGRRTMSAGSRSRTPGAGAAQPPRPSRADPPPAEEQQRSARREELQRMLAGFRVHGTVR